MRARCPQLGGQIFGALWSPREGHVQSAALTRAFAAAAVGLGARIEEGVTVKGLLGSGDRVTGVSTGSGSRPAGTVVLCAGAWSAHCASWLAGSWRLPIEPERGQVAILESSEHRFREIIAGAGLYLVPKRDGSLVVGATQERVGFEDHVTAEGVSGLLRDAFALAPELSKCGFREARSGLRPATPDGMPVIGAVPDVRALFVAAGHFRNGILMSPMTGQLVADRIAGREPRDDAGPFDPGRFTSAPGPKARSVR
jgi:glycine oxidase